MYQSYLIYFLVIQLFYYVSFFLFLVNFNNHLLIPVTYTRTYTRKVKEAPVIPAGIPTTEAYEAILNVPNDADKVINILFK